MGNTEMFELGGAFFVAWLVSFLLMPALAAWSHRAGMVVNPRLFGVGRPTVSYMGGMAVLVGLAATLLTSPDVIKYVWPYLLGGAALFSIGVMDDQISGGGLRPLFRLFLQTVVAAGTWWGGLQPVITGTIWIDAVLTVFVLVAAVNSINLLDNMDGLSAGIAAIAAGFFFILAAMNGQTLVAGLSVALSGCALGFLRTNFHPARIYMGDAGSLFIGFVLAVLGIKLRFVDAPQQIAFMVPVLVLGVAILDTTLVTVTRVKYGLNPFSGGRDHISHRLVFIGISVRSAVLLVYLAGVALGWLAIVMSRVDLTTGLILMGLVISVALFAGGMLGMIPVYEQSARRRMMLMEVLDHEDADARLSASN